MAASGCGRGAIEAAVSNLARLIVDDDTVAGGGVGRGPDCGFRGFGWFRNDCVTSGPVHAECGGARGSGLGLVRPKFKGCLSVSLLVCVGLDAEMVGGDFCDLSLATRFLHVVVVLLEGHFHAVLSGEDLHAGASGRPLDG